MVKKLKITMKFTVKNQEKAFTGFNRPYDGFGSQIYQVGETRQITKGELDVECFTHDDKFCKMNLVLTLESTVRRQ